MACNCETQKSLNKLYSEYGYKIDVSRSKTLAHNIKAIVQYCAALFICILISPFLVLYLIYKANDDDHNINISKLLRLKTNKNVRE